MTAAALTRGMGEFSRALPAKVRAAGIHVSISLGIFLVLLYLILTQWYPVPYFQTDGGWQGVRLMFAIDVVLGPLLTFVVFNPAKRRREIVTDLSLVAALQVAALAWGIFVVHEQRPVAIIEYDGRFESAVADDYAAQNIDLSALGKFDSRKPPVIFQRVPIDPNEMKEILGMMNGAIGRRALTHLYRPFADNLSTVFEQAASFEMEMADMDPSLVSDFKTMREEYGDVVGFLPFAGRHGTAVLVLARDGNIIDSLSVSDETAEKLNSPSRLAKYRR